MSVITCVHRNLIHLVPLSRSLVTVSTLLQRAHTYNDQFLMSLFARCKRDPVYLNPEWSSTLFLYPILSHINCSCQFNMSSFYYRLNAIMLSGKEGDPMKKILNPHLGNFS